MKTQSKFCGDHESDSVKPDALRRRRQKRRKAERQGKEETTRSGLPSLSPIPITASLIENDHEFASRDFYVGELFSEGATRKCLEIEKVCDKVAPIQ